MTDGRTGVEVRSMQRVSVFADWWPNLAAVLAIAIAILAVPFVGMALSPTDAYVYMAAGERLNDGHALYAIGPGDRYIGLNPPYWTVPTLSPPMMAVLWRPLSVFGPSGMLVGWALAGAAQLAALGIVVKRAPIPGLAATIVLAIPLGWQLGLGNVNGFLALGIVVLWLCRNRPWIAGALVALMVAVKVTPVVLVLWLVVTGRWRALGACAVASTLLLVVSIIFAGWSSHVEYLSVIAHTSSAGTTDLSLAGLLRTVGIPGAVANFAPWAAVAMGIALIIALRKRPGVAFAVAVVTIVLGSPVVQLYWYALLLVALVPIVDERRRLSRVVADKSSNGTFGELPERATNPQG